MSAEISCIPSKIKRSGSYQRKALKETGAFGFSNDGCGVQTAGTMYLAMKAAAEIDMPIVAHVEDNSLLFGGVMNAGKRAEELGK